ncbi:uncharacterized protein LOC132756309 [Ruditapes philippinarum]|uniref:uncharacterized protein LOC132756309 n=1 Tax=Ruditapes philippinarum TaxID=129788 RepID=UPI00295A5BEB|nr:uncharacterized protein LOC132756309 [Ruditapes philippinarum]
MLLATSVTSVVCELYSLKNNGYDLDMEVTGKKDFNEIDGFSCKPCEENELLSQADGFCTDCEEYMCTRCFEAHKKFKLNRGHTLAGSDEVHTKWPRNDDLEKCEKHRSEIVRFYCVEHEQVGCGDCMILEHKTCNVEYIEDKAKAFKDSSECQAFIKGPAMYQKEAKQLMASIEHNKIKAFDISEKFKQDVNSFREEIISHVKKVSHLIVGDSHALMETNILCMDNLAVETETHVDELNCLSKLVEAKLEKPNQLFVCSVLQKHKLKRLKEQLDDIKRRNRIEDYRFIRNNKLNLMSVTKGTGEFGFIRKTTEGNQTDHMGRHKEKVSVQSSVPVPQIKSISQPLQDRQLICRNITVNGACLTYTGNGKGDVGLYVHKVPLRLGSLFEVEILSLGQDGTIALGVVPTNYPGNKQPGWEANSAGYSASVGLMVGGKRREKPHEHRFLVGERIGFIITERSIVGSNPDLSVVFTKDGREIGQAVVHSYDKLYAAVGMLSPGGKVKIVKFNQI